FVKICKNGHLLEFHKNYTLYTKLNADFDYSISFLVGLVIFEIYALDWRINFDLQFSTKFQKLQVLRKNNLDFHDLRSI
ncbi:Uncharacterized protein APZ42_007697, partial [Daphnia magna]